jgi:hypothetical protein
MQSGEKAVEPTRPLRQAWEEMTAAFNMVTVELTVAAESAQVAETLALQAVNECTWRLRVIAAELEREARRR